MIIIIKKCLIVVGVLFVLIVGNMVMVVDVLVGVQLVEK